MAASDPFKFNMKIDVVTFHFTHRHPLSLFLLLTPSIYPTSPLLTHAQDISQVITKLGPCGHTLSPEEHAGLEVSMLNRQTSEHLPPLKFWGKIFGEEDDYLICYAQVEDTKKFGLADRKFYFCTTKEFGLKQLPVCSEELKVKAEGLTGRFKGDPSFPLEEESPEDEEEEEEEEVEEGSEAKTKPPKKETFREINRLSYITLKITSETSIIPVGSYIATASKSIIKNPSFPGLTYAASGNLRSYAHFRNALSPLAIASLSKPGLSRPTDIFDSLTDDKPNGAWTVTYDENGCSVYLRSLYWIGYFFFMGIGGGDFGGVYFGDGRENLDLAFNL